MKEVVDGKTLVAPEEGEDNMNKNTSVKFQKYFGKKQPHFYIGYDHQVDLKNDEFLNSLTKKEKEVFDEEMKKIWKEKMHHKEDVWYMVLEGKKQTGESKVKIYQDGEVFLAARDEEFLVDPTKYWSSKGCWFEDLASAKNYVQMAREEEGLHFDWPKQIPVVWKKGQLTKNDVEDFPGWVRLAEEVDYWKGKKSAVTTA